MYPGRLGTADIARLLGVSRPRVWQLRRQAGFPQPAGEEGGREYWYEDAILRWAANAGRELARRAPLLYRPAASDQPAHYNGARVIEGYVVLSWDAELGRVCLVYPPPYQSWTPVETLAQLIPGAAVVVAVRPDYDPWGPNLAAVDLEAPQREYSPRWTDLARILGMPAPWWPSELAKPEEMLRWVPGSPSTLTQAIPDLETGPLLRLAADEPDDSNTKTTLLHLARTIQQRSTESARHAIELLNETRDRDAIALAAIPATTRPPEDDPPELVRRDGWAQVLRRTDTLAAECVETVLRWDGGRDFPFGTLTQANPATDPVAAEWARTLVPSQRTAAFSMFDERSIVRTLQDPATDLPAAEDDQGDIRAAVPQFLPATTPLAEVILGDDVVWIRTEDRRLYIAPEQPGMGVSWGYVGGGPTTLAMLLDQLLDNINAPAPSSYRHRHEIPAGLLAGAEGGWETGALLTRADLLTARGT